jgi:MFS family permease
LAALPILTRYTYRAHLQVEALSSLFLGIFGLYEFVAKKSLNAADWEIVVLVSAAPAFNILAFFWSYVMEGRPKRPFILWTGILCRGALLLTAIATQSLPFVLLCCATFLADPVYIPAWNSIMQANYHPAWRGRMLGRVSLWTKPIFLAAALGTGEILRQDPGAYRLLFPVAGALGLLAYLRVAYLRVRHDPDRERTEPRPILSFFSALGNFRRILRENPDFDAFERNFFLYGIAFMILLPTHVLLLTDHLHMDYREISFAKLVLFQLAMALCAPFAGRYFDRWGAVRTAAASFAALALYPIGLLAAFLTRRVEFVYGASIGYGVAMAGVNGAWSLGAMHFSGRKDSAAFMGVHVTAVGVRGALAPFIGYAAGLVFDLGAGFARRPPPSSWLRRFSWSASIEGCNFHPAPPRRVDTPKFRPSGRLESPSPSAP